METAVQTLEALDYVFFAVKALGLGVLVVVGLFTGLNILGAVINFLGYVTVDFIEWVGTSERERQADRQRWQANAERMAKEQEERQRAFVWGTTRR